MRKLRPLAGVAPSPEDEAAAALQVDCPSSGKTPSTRQQGQAMVELALVVVLLMTMALGVFEFGRGFGAYIQLVQGAREGARVALDGLTDAQITSAVSAAAAPLTPVTTVVTRTSGQVSVNASYSFTTIVPMLNKFIGGETGTIAIQQTMVVRV